eukprot:Plantae.Rhodophyta-Purpureofilum_apyrenoidigerum.ctg4005.p2 GENE.Plantae.Rhodophyta-Purpureofilum_apyrenoidigerum.ctg4005~~Plantae.Rhodophyta-Purpureofilum_apyrenoidigerum.ctg4005.p2  ORF type:complete len:189 (+),score=40.04 Plantae.Rhodophyta-Purpureofilum_apyrenoidigerum.ctg4005:104-670(+)
MGMYSCICRPERVDGLRELLDKSITEAESNASLKQVETRKIWSGQVKAFRETFLKELQARMVVVREESDAGSTDNDFEGNFAALQSEVKSLEAAVLERRREIPQNLEQLFDQAINSAVQDIAKSEDNQESEKKDQYDDTTCNLQMLEEVLSKFDAAKTMLLKLQKDSECLSLDAYTACQVLQEQTETQ